MKTSDWKMLLIVITFIVAMLTLGGLGTIALQQPIYWVPFICCIPIFGIVCWRLFKESEKAVKDECKDKEER